VFLVSYTQMAQEIYSSYSKAKEVLAAINSLYPGQRPTANAQAIIKDFFEKDTYFKAFYSNVFEQKLTEQQKGLAAQTGNLQTQRLDLLKSIISSFIYQILGAPVEAEASLPPKEILDEINKAVEKSTNAEQAATNLIPSLKARIKNAETIWKDKLISEKALREEIPEPIKDLVYKQIVEKGKQLVQEHVAAGGDLDDPYRGKAIAQELTHKNPLIATYVNEKKLAKAVEEAWNPQTTTQDQILTSHLAEQLETQTELPTPGEVAYGLQTVAQSLNITLDDKQATNLLHEIEKTIATEGKDISTPEAIAQTISEKFKNISPESLQAFVEKTSPLFNAYRKGLEALIPKGRVSKAIADQTSILCKNIREATADFSLKKAFSWFTAFRSADLNIALPDFNIHIKKHQKAGKIIPQSLIQRKAEFEKIFEIIKDKNLPLPAFREKLEFASFIKKPISVIENYGGLFSKIPGLKGFGGFLQRFTPSNIKTRLAGRLLRSSLFKFAAQNVAKKGLKGLFSKGVLWLAGKLGGKGIATLVGTAIGGPVGAVAGFVITAVGKKVLGKLLNKKNLKKALAIAGGILTFGIGLLGGLISALGSAALAAGGVGMIAAGILIPTPLSPFLIVGGAGLALAGAWKSIIKPWLGKASSTLQAGIRPLIHNLSTGFGGASVPHYISLSPAIAIGSVASITVINYMTLISAFAIPPSGAEIGAPMGKVELLENYSCNHPACKIADIVQKYAGGYLTQNTWHKAEEQLRNALSPAAFEELHHSVWAVGSNLHCVGFKLASEKELGIDLPRQNAVSFLDLNTHSCPEVSANQAQPGDNVVWGPQPSCKAGQTCSDNIYCCGHIGVITKAEKSPVPGGMPRIYVTAAFGESGAVGTGQPIAADSPGKILRCN